MFFLVIWFLVGVYVLPSLLNAIRRYLNNETLLIILIIVVDDIDSMPPRNRLFMCEK